MNDFCLNTRSALLRHTALALAMSLGLSGAAFAQDASQLGKALTPIGAEKAGNAVKQAHGLTKAEVFIKGVGLGRDAAVRCPG